MNTVTPNFMTKQPLRLMGLFALGLMLFLWAGSVFAQVNTTDVLAPYRDFKPPEDMATRLMEGLLGQSFTSPLTAGLTANTLFGAIFLVFNIIVFAVGTVFASYGVIAGVVQTAHEGVVLGKRMSAVWMPVRMVTGIGGLIPAFGGFSLSQIIMIIAASWGISFGNYAYNQALQLAASGSTLINASFSRTDPNKDANAMAQALFRQRMCEIAAERKIQDLQAEGLAISPDVDVKERPIASVFPPGSGTGGAVVGRTVGTVWKPAKCYAVALQRKTYLGGLIDQGGRNSSSLFGFRSGAVNYEQINEQAWTGYTNNFPQFVSRVRSLADKYNSSLKAGTAHVPYPTQEIRAEGVWFAGAVQMAGVKQQNISQEALTNMGKFGFFAAGSYYSTHAEVNAAVIQAADATEFLIEEPDTKSELASDEYDYTHGTPEDKVGGAGVAGKKPYCIIGTNDTGNCSLGQKFVSLILDAGTAGAGGSATVVDPIIAMKNIGDYMMLLGEGILAVVVVASGDSNSVSGAVKGAILSGVTSIPIIGDFAKAIGGMAPYIGGLMFAVGALCAIYIPMVPFINWVSGLVQYCCIVVESFAAAPLWAFAHLQADGEGMGQRTERGYLYILNLLFRPILMVVAFFAASALVILLGSVVFIMFIPALAAAQGNSITGIFSAIGYIFLFFIIMNTIIQGLFHLVMELADDVIGWVGGIGRSSIGRDTEGKVNQVFMAGGRFGSGGVDRAASAMVKTGGGGAGGAVGGIAAAAGGGKK